MSLGAGSENSVLVRMHELSFTWPGDRFATLCIDAFQVKAGQNLFVMGASGSGKSTLLNIIGGVCQ